MKEQRCCEGVNPQIKERGGLVTMYYVYCPRCHEKGPLRISVVKAMTNWNRMLENKINRMGARI